MVTPRQLREAERRRQPRRQKDQNEPQQKHHRRIQHQQDPQSAHGASLLYRRVLTLMPTHTATTIANGKKPKTMAGREFERLRSLANSDTRQLHIPPSR